VPAPSRSATRGAVIGVEGLRKRFGPVWALQGVDLAVRRGTICGLLGPNGAGKTTTVRILVTLLRPDGGAARVGGHDVARQPERVRPLIGLTGQYAAVDEERHRGGAAAGQPGRGVPGPDRPAPRAT
jgi:ABC-2 type transport system ATP-binding protein